MFIRIYPNTAAKGLKKTDRGKSGLRNKERKKIQKTKNRQNKVTRDQDTFITNAGKPGGLNSRRLGLELVYTKTNGLFNSNDLQIRDHIWEFTPDTCGV